MTKASADGGPCRILLIHGFNGHPSQMRPLADFLESQGFPVRVVTLQGHATRVEDLERVRREDWIRQVEEEYAGLARDGPAVAVGHSMGGSLALILAARRGLPAVVTLNTPVHYPRLLAALYPLAKALTPRLVHLWSDASDPEARRQVEGTYYPTVPSSSVGEFLQVVEEAGRCLRQVRCPLLVVHSRRDHVIPPGNAPRIFRGAGSRDKELLWLERSFHLSPLDRDRELLQTRIADFLKSCPKAEA